MEHDLDHLWQQVKRAKRWAIATPDPTDRERIEAVVRDYEEMARTAEQNSRADQQRR